LSAEQPSRAPFEWGKLPGLPEKQWFTAAEIAAMRLAGFPATGRSILRLADAGGWLRTEKVRRHIGQGGGYEFHITVLPPAVFADFLVRFSPAASPEKFDEWKSKLDWFHGLTGGEQAAAARRLEIIRRFHELQVAGLKIVEALRQCEQQFGVSKTTISEWIKATRGVPDDCMIAYLVPKKRGPQRGAHG
jgi:hypothetical protein